MKLWPRGKYNGRRLTGFSVTLVIDVWPLTWRPRMSWNFGSPYVVWLFARVRAQPQYCIEDR